MDGFNWGVTVICANITNYESYHYFIWYNKQLLDEAEHDIKNYSDRGD